MKYDEFAFLNQQLAGMLKAGIPLEGALKQLCASMRRGDLKQEYERLGAELTQGTPLESALAARRLPEFYKAMVRVGVAGHDLPAVLTLLADHYQRENSILTRLKGLMVYPVIVLAAAFGLSLALSLILNAISKATAPTELGLPINVGVFATLWVAPVVLGLAAAAACVCVTVPSLRRSLRWHVPGFREASLAEIASSLALMLERGTSLDRAIHLMRECESGSPAGAELARWEARLAEGQGKAAAFAAGGSVFPPLFVWLADHAGEDLAAGFGRAASIYQARAMFRVEMMLYAFLPVSVLLLGLMIIGQVYPVLRIFKGFFTVLGSDGG